VASPIGFLKCRQCSTLVEPSVDLSTTSPCTLHAAAQLTSIQRLLHEQHHARVWHVRASVHVKPRMPDHRVHEAKRVCKGKHGGIRRCVDCLSLLARFHVWQSDPSVRRAFRDQPAGHWFLHEGLQRPGKTCKRHGDGRVHGGIPLQLQSLARCRGDYGYDRNTQQYFGSSENPDSGQCAHGYRRRGGKTPLPIKRVSPYALAGGGGLIFDPTGNAGGSVAGASTQGRAPSSTVPALIIS